MVRVGGQIWYSREIHSTLFVVLIPGFNLRWCTKNYNPKVCGDKISTSKTFGVCKGFAKVGRSALANEIGVSVQKIKQIVNLPYDTIFGHFRCAHFVGGTQFLVSKQINLVVFIDWNIQLPTQDLNSWKLSMCYSPCDICCHQKWLLLFQNKQIT